MPASHITIALDAAAMTSTEQRNAFAVLSHQPLDRFNLIKRALHLTVPDVLGPTTLAVFLRYCLNAGFDLSSDGVRQFKSEHGLDPNKPILEVTAEAYFRAFDFERAMSGDAPWMEYASAELAARVKEFPGEADNPRVVEYLRSTTLPPPYINHDTTAWCSAFVNWCMMKADIKRTKDATARSWLGWGDALEAGKYGAIVILATQPAPHGHVAFLVGDEGETIRVLGGNQGDAVSQTSFSKQIVLGYRWPKPEYALAVVP